MSVASDISNSLGGFAVGLADFACDGAYSRLESCLEPFADGVADDIEEALGLVSLLMFGWLSGEQVGLPVPSCRGPSGMVGCCEKALLWFGRRLGRP